MGINFSDIFIKIILFLFLSSSCLYASSNWSGRGEITLESRSFENDGNWQTEDEGFALYSQVETKYEGEDWSFIFRGFGRHDKYDSDRNILELEDFFLQREAIHGRVRIGYQVFNWSSTEAFHPVDTINSRNFDSDQERLEKLGELTLEYEFDFFDGNLNLYYFPRIKDSKYPGKKSRLGKNVNILNPIYHHKRGRRKKNNRLAQFGARLTQTIGSADLSVHAFRQMDRQNPLFELKFITVDGAPSLNTEEIQPHYFMFTQVGATLQWAFEDDFLNGFLEGYLLKVETATKNFDTFDPILTNFGLRRPGDFSQHAIGLEKSVSLLNGHQTTFILELQTITGADKKRRDEIMVFQNDGLFAFRHDFNDVLGRELFISFIADLEKSREFIYNLKYAQRISDFWKINTGLRIIDAPQKGLFPKGLENFDGDNQVFLNLSRFF